MTNSKIGIFTSGYELVVRILYGFVLIFSFSFAANSQPVLPSTLTSYLEEKLAAPSGSKNKLVLKDICDIEADAIAARVFREYGAMFAASNIVIFPPTCIFESGDDLAAFHKTLKIKSTAVNGVIIELQEAAMNALNSALSDARSRGLRITPLDGVIAGKRNYADTVRIWNSRFIPALDYWVAKGKISHADANVAFLMPVRQQVMRVVEWEARGIYFSTSRTRTIFSSAAPPGASQHLSLLAFDIEQSGNRTVREILNRNGWYQTVLNDTPHFTFLGLPETELPKRGLKKALRGGHKYWLPIVADQPQTDRPSTETIIRTPR